MNIHTTFPEFAEKWIEKNVKTELYPDMKKYLLELVRVFNSQQHSGGSAKATLHYFFKLNKEWDNPS